MPCVVTIQKPNYDPRYPTIKSKMAARKKPIGELEVGEIPESSMEVVKVYAPAKRQARCEDQSRIPGGVCCPGNETHRGCQGIVGGHRK